MNETVEHARTHKEARLEHYDWCCLSALCLCGELAVKLMNTSSGKAGLFYFCIPAREWTRVVMLKMSNRNQAKQSWCRVTRLSVTQLRDTFRNTDRNCEGPSLIFNSDVVCLFNCTCCHLMWNKTVCLHVREKQQNCSSFSLPWYVGVDNAGQGCRFVNDLRPCSTLSSQVVVWHIGLAAVAPVFLNYLADAGGGVLGCHTCE